MFVSLFILLGASCLNTSFHQINIKCSWLDQWFSSVHLELIDSGCLTGGWTVSWLVNLKKMRISHTLLNASKFRTVFDFGEREVAHWFPGHMAKGLFGKFMYKYIVWENTHCCVGEFLHSNKVCVTADGLRAVTVQ